MIDTIITLQAQLHNGYFQSGTGPTQIMIMGSCRTIALLNYLVRWNDTGGNNQFTIRRIDPCDWVVSNVDLASLETDERILSVLRSSKIFIHEYTANYGMFNTDRQCQKNVYQFGMNPDQDITVPGWHDVFCLYNDFAAFNALSDDWSARGEAAIKKACDLCNYTSLPEMGEYIRDNWRKVRLFWRPNHVSSAFTLYLFQMINDRFLNLPLDENFWNGAQTEDLFREPNTEVTQQDRDAYGITWN